MSVLGGLMLADERSAFQVFGMLTVDDFYREDHRVVFSALKWLHDNRKPLDYVMVSERLKSTGESDAVGGFSYIAGLANDVLSGANVAGYAEIVKDHSKRRNLIAACSEACDGAYNADEIESATTKLITSIEGFNRSRSKAKRLSDALSTADDVVREAGRRRSSGSVGVPFGLPAIDNRIVVSGPRLVGIAARPSTGKTALLLQMARTATSRGYPGLIVSIEMGDDQLANRMRASQAGVNFTKLIRGYDEEADHARKADEVLAELPLWIDTAAVTLNEVLSTIALHRHQHGIEWAAIDYLQKITMPGNASMREKLATISGALLNLAKRLNMPLIPLIQLSRANEKEGRRPRMDDLRECGELEQDLNALIMMHVPREERNKSPRKIELGLEKNRDGLQSWLSEQFEFNGATQTFRELVSGQTVASIENYRDRKGN